MSKRKRRGSASTDLGFPHRASLKTGTSLPSRKAMEDMFWEIVDYIKNQGCQITIHKNLEKVNGSNGYFSSEPKPHIKAAIKNKSWPKAIELVIHEFCHYWQWKDGFINRADDDGNIIYGRILDGEEVTPAERHKASVLVRLSEYDCEIRTASLFEKWNLESIFPPEEHIKSANTYNRHIVWSIGDKDNVGSSVFYPGYDKLAEELWGDKVFRYFWNPKTSAGLAKILSPISKRQKSIFDAAQRKNKKSK